MATLTTESFTGEQPMRVRPVYSHDRTIITVFVLACGTALLWHFGESVPVVALVSSMWTLCLTFWFRIGPSGPNGSL